MSETILCLAQEIFMTLFPVKKTGLITSPQSPPPISHKYDKLIKLYGQGLLIKFQRERFVSSLEETYCFSVNVRKYSNKM